MSLMTRMAMATMTKMMSMKRAALLAGVLVAGTGCPGHGGGHYAAPAVTVTVADVIAKLEAQRTSRTSFTGESTMDYWLGDQRVKGTVLVMGTSRRQVRFNALSPQGGGVLADMACNGTDYQYVDFQHNCQLAGPCNAASIASLLRIALEPDDFLRLAVGGVPVAAGSTGTVTWDAAKGYWRVQLASAAGKQSIVIDARDNHWDVIASELVGIDGKQVWAVENADFADVADSAGTPQRLPGKTRFKSAGEHADLLVAWTTRTLNVSLEPAKFVVDVPPGLPTCGASSP